MREDVLEGEVIALTRRVEDELPDHEGLHEATRRLRHLLLNLGNVQVRDHEIEQDEP